MCVGGVGGVGDGVVGWCGRMVCVWGGGVGGWGVE